jgi:hypothetical protein
VTHKYVTTPASTLDQAIWGIVGPPGEGKTFLALTASEKWPDKLTLGGPETVLEDVVVFCHDPSGLVGLAPYGIRPDLLIDMGAFCVDNGGAEKGHRMLGNLGTELLKVGRHKHVIIDTVSTLASDISNDVWSSPTMSSGGQVDGIATNKRVRESILRWCATYEAFAKKLGASLIPLFHAKFSGDFAMDKAEDRQLKKDANGQDEKVSIDVVGSAKDVMQARCSEIMVLQKNISELRGQKVVTRSVRFSLKGWNTKSRLQAVFDPDKDYPANLRELRRLAKEKM